MSEPAIVFLGTAVPDSNFSQEILMNAMEPAMEMDRREKLLFRKIFTGCGVEKRHTVIKNISSDETRNELFNCDPSLPNTSGRMQLYRESAPGLVLKAFSSAIKNNPGWKNSSITHVVTFSCTGMYAPGLDIELVEALGLNQSVERTTINFMGCYAAFNALKAAYHICRSMPGSTVLLAGVELCSLHYKPGNDYDSMVANAIFSDGASAVIVSSDEKVKNLNNLTLGMHHFFSALAPEGKNEMVWTVGDFGFSLRLSDYVPGLVRSGIRELAEKLLHRMELDFNDLHFYAIHPGGLKILQACEEALEITRDKTSGSYHILKNYGNMSSVTVLFVLEKIMKEIKNEDHGKNIFSCAFGPGLTLESMLLKINQK